jgi:hypothetical protein
MTQKCFYLLLFCLYSLTLPPAYAQVDAAKWKGTTPVGKFLADSIQIGKPVQYVFTLKHPADMEVIFPDSTYNYAPFEWLSKAYFPTRTDQTGSIDSVVYTFTTFEIDSLQTLRLPIYIIHQKDCTAVYAEPDSLWLQQLITQSTDTLTPKANVRYFPVETYFNYPLLLLAIGGIIGFFVLVYALFGKQLAKQYRLYRLSREHAHFSNTFERLTKRIKKENSVDTVENAVILWKNYMETLENQPFSTYTTKEIIEVLPNRQLAEALQNTDRIIYGQVVSGDSVRSTRVLASIAKRSYIEKRTLLKNQKQKVKI